MPGSILVAGHASIDTVTNSSGRRKQPGGAAIYAAVAARVFNDDVRLATVVGEDYEYKELLRWAFPGGFIKVVRSDSTRFEIEYDEGWNANYKATSFGAARFLRADEIVEAAAGRSYVHLAPMPPGKVSKILKQLRRTERGSVVSVNTWEGYMRRGEDRRLLAEVARDSDFFIVNEREIGKLTGIGDAAIAAKQFESRQLIVTLGELGAIYVKEGQLSLIPATVGIRGGLVDTTGAGDAWCGAFLGAYALTGSLEPSVMAASIISALKCRGWNFQKLLDLKFGSVEDLVDYVVRLRGGGQMTMRRYFR
ncbi:MAG: carbohydrate kinase family protein [Candidatus Brockarchaeota archaeon]|nr:carbohydrate kinase family protein [Candidatus Brockarchaeota archaeon]